jgi:hypothetical protein
MQTWRNEKKDVIDTHVIMSWLFAAPDIFERGRLH